MFSKLCRVLTGFAFAAASILCATTARADSSCDALFDTLRGSAGQQGSFIHVLWTTNYFVPQRNARFVATTRLNLVLGRGDLAGASVRRQSVFEDVSRPAVERADNVILRIRADGKVMFNDQYGPYDPVCSNDKFALVNSGDSLETFSFEPGNARGKLAGVQPRPIGAGGTSGAGGSAATAAPEEARQWEVANDDTVRANVNYGLFNLRRQELRLTSQLGYRKKSDEGDLGWTGASGGYFLFVRHNRNDQRPVEDGEVVAIYNTYAKAYMTGRWHQVDSLFAAVGNMVHSWSSAPAYEWVLRGRQGTRFALYNTKRGDYLVLGGKYNGADNSLIFLNCAKTQPDEYNCIR